MNSPADVFYLPGLHIFQCNRPEIVTKANHLLRASQRRSSYVSKEHSCSGMLSKMKWSVPSKY